MNVILNIRNQFTPMERQRRQLDLVKKTQRGARQGTAARYTTRIAIEAFEMAFKMQTEATDAFDHQEGAKRDS
jgi:hypothetical protein